MHPVATAPELRDTAPQAPALTASDVTASFRGPPHRFVTVGPHRLAYRCFGRGPDVVFVHGWPLHAATFRGIVARLAERFTCHLFDLPSAGQTESAPDAPLDFMAYGETVCGLATALGLERYALVAHDSGGLVARLAAAEDPRVVALVLGDTEIPGHHSALVALYAALARAPIGADLVRRLMSVGAVKRSRLGFGGCFADPRHVDGEFDALFVQPMLASRASARRQFAPFRTFDARAVDRLEEVHARITAPVRLVWGTDDPIFPVEKARRMLGQFPRGATMREIPGGRAFVHDERPAAFAEHAAPFLEASFGGALPRVTRPS